MALTAIDGSTFPAGQLKERVDANLWGWNGSFWVPFAITGGGSLTVSGSPGSTITSPADTAVGIGATVSLPVVPAGTRRMTVEVTVGDSTSRIRIREMGGIAGSGRLLSFLGSTMYGGADGAVERLEAENVAGPVSAVHVDFEIT